VREQKLRFSLVTRHDFKDECLAIIQLFYAWICMEWGGDRLAAIMVLILWLGAF